MVRSLEKLHQMRKWHGSAKTAAFLGKSFMERALRFRIDRVSLFEWRSANEGRPLDERFEWRFLTPAEIRSYAAFPETDVDGSLARRVERGDLCFGAILGGRLISYRAYAIGSVDPEHSGGVRMHFPREAVYVYKGFTLPEYRGRHMLGRPYSHALKHLLEMGIHKMITLIDFTNWSSLQVNQRAGYRDLGVLVTHHLGKGRVIYVSPAVAQAGIYFKNSR